MAKKPSTAAQPAALVAVALLDIPHLNAPAGSVITGPAESLGGDVATGQADANPAAVEAARADGRPEVACP
jgi:hypothetical protein